ncbi:MAG TPA: tetratricopeptide repeat protein, partial [Candidatus Limnocylindria bacterium]|nr:tetratricopeptide repeat protein [Candidatus Limnocylindria bacterium]
MRHDAAKRCPLGRVATLALVSAFALPLLSSPATAARASASRGAVEDPPPVVAPRTLDVKPVAPGGNELLLRRAAMELRLGNLHTVVENLEGIGFSAPSSFVGTDRAAFLLGQAYLRLGAHDRFVRLARVVSEWERESIYTQWVAYQLLLVDAETGAGSAPDSSQTQRLVVARGLAAGTPLGLYLEALGRSAGADAERTWTELSDADTASVLGRDLAGAALLRRATLMIQRGEDPRTLLQAVPPGSRYASRALHMLGVVCMERGDGERGAAVLDSLLADDPDYAARREVRLALAGQALDQNRWEDADRIYQSIDRDWTGHRDTLQRILSGNAFDSLWPAWQRGNALSDALPLDALPSRMLAERLAAASTDFGAGPSLAMPPLDAPPPRATLAWPVASPPPAAWSALAISERRLGETRYELERTRWTIDREREALGDWRRYLDIGFDRAGREADSLRARSTLLDSLRRTLDALDARLVTVRDESTHRLLARTAELLRSCENSLLWLRAMRHFHIDGPNHARATTAPTGLPSQEMLVTNEAALARAVLGFAERFAAETPALIARSYQDAWRPGLIDRAWTLGDDVKSYLAWARKLGTSIDSSIAAASSSERLRRLEALAAQLDRTTDSLAVAHEQLRTRVAREAVERTLATLASEREGIDYGLAASAYGLAVGLGEPDAGTRTASSDLTAATESTPDSAAAASENDTAPESPEAARSRAHAIERLRSFLAAHPGSFARGEMRFRLADLLIVDGRQQFRERMARYVRAQAEGRAPGASLPVLSHAPALELYRTILQEDREFEHRDAVLFNAGMILADEADPEAARFFGDLVTQHPESPYRQQAYLRMGDLRFNHKQFAECIELYRHAADGPDTSLRAIALYKMGWAHFNEDRFVPAADAFRAVLDLYQARSGIKLQVDIEREAETYFVHALARAGGAEAFAGTFDRIGARPYEIRILMALGQHFRRYSLYAEATAVDELGLKRYPLHP